MNKLADAHYVQNFAAVLHASPGSHRGLFAPLINSLVLPHIDITAFLARATELGVGLVLLVGAVDVVRRRLGRPLYVWPG